MPLCFRIIARIDVRNDQAIQPLRREGVRPVGNPRDLVRRYDADGADEFFFCDCVASLYRRNTLAPLIEWMTEHAFCPVTVAGGVRSAEDVRALLNAGADKIAVNTAALETPGLLNELANRFGSSTIALQLDAKQHPGRQWEAYTHGGRQPSGRDAVTWAHEAVQRGVGEVIATAIDNDGMRRGMDQPLAEALSPLSVPVVVSGGAAAPDDVFLSYRRGVSGVALGAALHYGNLTIPSTKQFLHSQGVPVRCEFSSPVPVDLSDHT